MGERGGSGGGSRRWGGGGGDSRGEREVQKRRGRGVAEKWEDLERGEKGGKEGSLEEGGGVWVGGEGVKKRRMGEKGVEKEEWGEGGEREEGG